MSVSISLIKCGREETTSTQCSLRVFAPLRHWTSRESFFRDHHGAAEPTTLSLLAENSVTNLTGRHCCLDNKFTLIPFC